MCSAGGTSWRGLKTTGLLYVSGKRAVYDGRGARGMKLDMS